MSSYRYGNVQVNDKYDLHGSLMFVEHVDGAGISSWEFSSLEYGEEIGAHPFIKFEIIGPTRDSLGFPYDVSLEIHHGMRWITITSVTATLDEAFAECDWFYNRLKYSKTHVVDIHLALDVLVKYGIDLGPMVPKHFKYEDAYQRQFGYKGGGYLISSFDSESLTELISNATVIPNSTADRFCVTIGVSNETYSDVLAPEHVRIVFDENPSAYGIFNYKTYDEAKNRAKEIMDIVRARSVKQAEEGK